MARPASARPASARPARKRADRYHHGDLRRALLQAAVRTIATHGVAALTLRAVGSSLGVSRTALYRHFSDKSALLGAVAAEGFRMLRAELFDASRAGGRAGFEAMGAAYVRFALAHPAHYRVMFGTDIGAVASAELNAEGEGAFQVLVDSIVEQQTLGLVRTDHPGQMALFIWATVHGIAMLAIDGRLEHQAASVDSLTQYAIERLRTGVATVDRA
jgi:AcrR family transcriptional regulator